MPYKILFILFLFFLSYSNSVNSQTVIEMTDPGDANFILLVVNDIKKADIVVYKTHKMKEVDAWDCMWKFKKWGFSNFTIFLTLNPDDSIMSYNESGIKYHFNGKIFFTDNKEERGYKTPGFVLEGIFRKNNATTDSTKNKEYIRQLKNKVW
jgi:hypothetical protein